MADIKQAAKWMQEGKDVFDPMGFRIYNSDDEVRFRDDDEKFELLVSDALSDDWEIAH